jgi:hypothetical protein
MTTLHLLRGKDGNTIGSTIKKTDTGITTARDRHGNVLGYGDSKRDQTRDRSGNLVRWSDDVCPAVKDNREQDATV